MYVRTACIAIDHFYYQVGVAPQKLSGHEVPKENSTPSTLIPRYTLYDTQTIGLIIGVEGLAFEFGGCNSHDICGVCDCRIRVNGAAVSRTRTHYGGQWGNGDVC